MTRIEASVERTRRVHAARSDVWDVMSEPERFAHLVPDVESHERVGDGWRWVLRAERRMGVRIQPRFTVRYHMDPPAGLRFEHVAGEDSGTDAGGECTLADADGATDVTFRLDIGIDLDVPGLLRGRVRAILEEEITRLADGFLDNLAEAARDSG